MAGAPYLGEMTVTNSKLDKAVEASLEAAGQRYTRARRAVVGTLAGADGPLSAGELHARMSGSVPLSSVYRTVGVLEEVGILVPHFGVKGLTRYELAEWISGHHHHLVCVECGNVDDVGIPADLEATIREVVGVIAARASFDPVAHVLEIEGRCSRCS
jgi:Fe2+ or Zn2+ uptake regulation protein